MRAWLQKARDAVMVFLPKSLQEILARGLFKVLLVLVAGVFVLPVATLSLAALTLQVMNRSDYAFMRAAGRAITDAVHEGLSTEEVAARSNARLDYLQWFEVRLTPKKRSKRDLALNIKRGQKVIIEFRALSLHADSVSCSVPEDDPELVEIYLGRELLRRLPAGSNQTIILGKQWWENAAKSFDDDQLLQTLGFRLTPEARELGCGEVSVEGGVQVFKDLYIAGGGGGV